MRARQAGIVLVALLAASPVARAATEWEHPDFASDTARPHRILVLPPQAEMVRSRVNEGVPLVKETADLEKGLAESTEATLVRLGYEADAKTLSTEALAADPDLKALVRALTDALDEVMANVADQPRGIREGRYTVGEPALALGARTGGEGFLFIQAQAIIPSKGRRTLAALLGVASGGVPIPPTNVTQAIAILVDGRSGDVSAVKIGSAGGAVVKEPELVARKVVADTFRSYPAKGVAHRIGKRATRRAAERRATTGDPPSARPAQQTEEEVLAAFEAAAAEAPAEDVVPQDRGEIVESRREFEVGGATPSDVGVLDPATLPPPTSPVGSAGPATPPPVAREPAPVPSPEGPDPRATWEAPAAARPAPTRQVVFQMLDGGPALSLRNVAEPTVLVSVDLGPWIPLAAGETRLVQVAAGSHRLLVADLDGREIARASCIVGADRVAVAEVWPR